MAQTSEVLLSYLYLKSSFSLIWSRKLSYLEAVSESLYPLFLLTAPISGSSAREWVGWDVPAADPGEDQLDHAGHGLQLGASVLGPIARGLIAAHGPSV